MVYMEVGVSRTKVFYNNRTQAIRLSKDVAMPDTVTEVDVIADGDARIVTPVDRTWAHWWDRGPTITDDFLRDRAQPMPQEREL